VQPDGGSAWSFDAGSQASAPPVAVGPHVVMGTPSGRLILLDASTGALIANVPVNGSGQVSALSAADGMLFVSSGNTLSAY
jgi:outer membrane protein assembly factor BamB